MLTSILNRVLTFIATPKKSKINKKDPSQALDESINLQKKFLNEEDRGDFISDEFIDRETQSMKDSQGNADFSGSAYNGPGKMENEKRNANMGQRNFQS